MLQFRHLAGPAVLLLALSAPAFAEAETVDPQFQADRDAILAMAGDYKVAFDFRETVPLTEGYELKDDKLSFSAGIAFAPEAGASLTECTKAADIALYRAKISGRNTDIVWGEHLNGVIRHAPADQGNRGGDNAPKAKSGYKGVSL